MTPHSFRSDAAYMMPDCTRALSNRRRRVADARRCGSRCHQTGRILAASVMLTGLLIVVALLVLWSYQSARQAMLQEMTRELARYADTIDTEVARITSQLTALRRWSGDILESSRTLSAHPWRPLISPLEGQNVFTLDAVSQLPENERYGNLWGLASPQTRGAAFEREQAMALWLLPLLDSLRNETPYTSALQYSSVRGFYVHSPWLSTDNFVAGHQATDAEVLLAGLQETDLIQLGRIQNNPQRLAFWSDPYASPGDGSLKVYVALPVDDRNRFKGVLSAELTTSILRQHAPRVGLPRYSLFVSTRPAVTEDRFLTASTGGEVLFATGDPHLRDSALLMTEHNTRDIHLTRPLENAPWSVHLIVPSEKLQRFVWVSIAPLVAMSILVMLLGLALVTGRSSR